MSEQTLILVPIIIGVVEVVKKVGLKNKYAPLLALALGIAGGLAVVSNDVQGLIQGTMLGLSASGLFAGYKTVVK